MTPAPRLHDEPQRLTALRELLLLDSPAEERFDRIVQFAATEFDVPVVLLSLVDEERQFFKASVGAPVRETPRDISFCGHAIAGREMFVVEDAARDERFADNPLVAGPLAVRFYAGAPLHLADHGSAVGTLCILDTVPRSLDATDLAILASLRDLTLEEIASRRPHA